MYGCIQVFDLQQQLKGINEKIIISDDKTVCQIIKYTYKKMSDFNKVKFSANRQHAHTCAWVNTAPNGVTAC